MAATNGLGGATPATSTPSTPYWKTLLAKRKNLATDANGNPIQGNILSSLAGSQENAVNGNLNSMLDGSAYDATRASTNEAMARGAQSMRAQNAGANAGTIGQGGAVAAQNRTEGQVYNTLAETQLRMNEGEQATKERGMTFANTLAAGNENIRQFNVNSDQSFGSQIAGNDLTQQNVDNSSAQFDKTYGLAQDQFKITQDNANAGKSADFATYISKLPPGTDWTQDAHAIALQQRAGLSDADARSLATTSGISEEQAGWSQLHASTAYKNATAEEQGNLDNLHQYQLNLKANNGQDVRSTYDAATKTYHIVNNTTGAVDGKTAAVGTTASAKSASSNGADDSTVNFLNTTTLNIPDAWTNSKTGIETLTKYKDDLARYEALAPDQKISYVKTLSADEKQALVGTGIIPVNSAFTSDGSMAYDSATLQIALTSGGNLLVSTPLLQGANWTDHWTAGWKLNGNLATWLTANKGHVTEIDGKDYIINGYQTLSWGGEQPSFLDLDGNPVDVLVPRKPHFK